MSGRYKEATSHWKNGDAKRLHGQRRKSLEMKRPNFLSRPSPHGNGAIVFEAARAKLRPNPSSREIVMALGNQVGLPKMRHFSGSLTEALSISVCCTVRAPFGCLMNLAGTAFICGVWRFDLAIWWPEIPLNIRPRSVTTRLLQLVVKIQAHLRASGYSVNSFAP